ncbi:Mitochondrial Rho GTPase 1 [Zea mays]|uniref:Mitochondrial Rho GTPase 1 n=2 Tax=Zea mays TaxID=4577 RepID=A0A1D6L915_MAIZE|nr:Mitochondrial Rho GTPase 1 [Zea mays]
MAGATSLAAAANLAGKSSVRVVVIGDPGTGKSSLIVALATEQFPENVPRVMPPTRLPADYFPDRVPITIIDTSSSPEQKPKLIAECQAADAVVLTYACDRPATLERLSSFWLPELRRLQLKAPVIVVGCKLDLRDEQQVSLEQVMAPIMQSFREIETCIECSALRQIQVPEVFYYAQKAVLHPTAPLFDQELQALKPRCVRALKRIFIICDNDKDGALSDVELNEFQVRCFNAPLQPTEISGVKRVVQEKMPEGVNESGLTLTGFLFLHALFIEKGRLETTWTVLRKFGYDNDIKLRDDLIAMPIKRAPDQTLEMTSEVVDFLRGIFNMFDIDNDGALLPTELEDLFSTAPEKLCDRYIHSSLLLFSFASPFLFVLYISAHGFLIPIKTVLKRMCWVVCHLKVFSQRQPSDTLPSNSERFATNSVEMADVSQDMGIETPIPISVKLRDLNNIFCRIVHAAQQPHLSIPETETGKARRQYRQLLNRSLMVVSVGAAVAVVGLAAYRVYAARKNSSS